MASRMRNATIAITEATGYSTSGNAFRNARNADGNIIVNERARNTPDENASPLGNPSELRARSGLNSGK